jgi:hypothetical protein
MILRRAAMPPLGPLMAPLVDSNCYSQVHKFDEVQNGLDSFYQKLFLKLFILNLSNSWLGFHVLFA